MAPTEETMRHLATLRTEVGGEADTAIRQLATAWVRAWNTLAPTLREAILELAQEATTLGRWPRPWEISRLYRLAAALQHTQAALDTLTAATTATVTAAATTAIDATATTEPLLITSQLPAAERATTPVGSVPPQALDAIVARTQARITASTWPISADATEAIRRSLIRGVALGDNPRTTARMMLRTCQGEFNGGLARALNIARTETLDAYRVTSRESHAANADLLAGWQWICTLSDRTCPACIAKHGSTHPVTEPGPLDHQSGRCARVPVTKTWRQLGINIDEPPSAVPGARAWFAELPDDQRSKILGPGRLALLDSGRITWDDIPKVRPSSEWRDSYAPRSLTELRTIAATRKP